MILLLIALLSGFISENNSDKFYAENNPELSVYIFVSETCPICINLTPEFNSIQEKFGKKARILLVFPNSKVSSEKGVEHFKTRYSIKSQSIIDYGQNITKEVGATITPEVFVIENSSKRTIYSGMISDEYVALGKRKRSKVNHLLLNVLTDYFENDIFDFVPNKAVGCFIIKE